MFIIRNSIV